MTVVEKVLVAILKHQDEKTLIKINKEWLDTTEIPVLDYVLDYYRTNHELIGLKSFCSKFKLDPDEADSRPSLYLRELKDRFIFAEISERVPGLLKKLKNNPRVVLNTLTEMVSELNSEEGTSTDTRYSDNVDKRKNDYKDRRDNKGVTYLSMGHKVLDDIFSGYGKNDLVTVAGRAGSKKSWLLCLLAVLCELVLPEDFGDILFITNEMTAEQLCSRMDVIRFKLPFSPFIKGALTRKEYQRFMNGLDELPYSRIIFSENVTTVDEVAEKIGLYSPSICFIDGSYLLEQTSKLQGHERIQLITRGLKKLTLSPTRSCPIINTTQMTRGSGKKSKGTSFDAQDEFAFGSSYVQDSDLAIRMFADKEMIYRQEVGMQVAKGRNVDGTVQPIFLCNLNSAEFDFFLDEFTDTEVNGSNNDTDLI